MEQTLNRERELSVVISGGLGTAQEGIEGISSNGKKKRKFKKNSKNKDNCCF